MNASAARSAGGRPLRFLGLVLGGWVAARAGLAMLPLLGQMSSVPADPLIAHHEPDPTARVAMVAQPALLPPRTILPTRSRSTGAMKADVGGGGWDRFTVDQLLNMSTAFRRPRSRMTLLEAAARESEADFTAPDQPFWLPGASDGTVASTASRWALVGWTLWRPQGVAALAQGPLLGGSQAGLRFDYRLGGAGGSGLALYGRVTRALDRPFGTEAALGVSLRPVAGVPVALMVERRQRLGAGGRSGFALLATGGIGPRPLGDHIGVEGYAQAGVVGLPGADAFADGQLALGYRLSAPGQPPRLALGAAVSASAQRGAARLDLGPAAQLRLPLGRGHMRLSAEWRERIAGAARPRRGPAITLVADF